MDKRIGYAEFFVGSIVSSWEQKILLENLLYTWVWLSNTICCSWTECLKKNQSFLNTSSGGKYELSGFMSFAFVCVVANGVFTGKQLIWTKHPNESAEGSRAGHRTPGAV